MGRNQNHGQNPLPSCMEHFSEIYGTVQYTALIMVGVDVSNVIFNLMVGIFFISNGKITHLISIALLVITSF